ncbi:MAG TPA: Spy/CpxP family protein refolding chaperone [Hyphomicrobiaceae bacterium]|jgi:hypothetical protein|nr:Spy/CpxP family protein refolding chaperone [Hyphomicrobiaceae bacterium]
MKTRTLVIGGITVTALLAGGWALAQSVGPPNGFGPPFMRGQGHGAMGPGIMKGMHGMGPGMMKGMDGEGDDGMGPGMMNGMHGIGPGMMKGKGGHGPGMMKGMGPMMHGRGAFADPAQIDALKGELGITTAQETAWGKYAKAVQDAAAAMKTARESVDPGAVSKMAPAERFAFVSKMREQGQKRFETVSTAANELLAVLDDNQKTKAHTILPGLAFGPGPMWGPFAAH